jgi:hypothetical protein
LSVLTLLLTSSYLTLSLLVCCVQFIRN